MGSPIGVPELAVDTLALAARAGAEFLYDDREFQERFLNFWATMVASRVVVAGWKERPLGCLSTLGQCLVRLSVCSAQPITGLAFLLDNHALIGCPCPTRPAPPATFGGSPT
jgi:hypothetical protein